MVASVSGWPNNRIRFLVMGDDVPVRFVPATAGLWEANGWALVWQEWIVGGVVHLLPTWEPTKRGRRA